MTTEVKEDAGQVGGLTPVKEGVGFTSGPWEMLAGGRGVWAPNAKVGGVTKIFDIRGWGYLTGEGHGALGLSKAEAIAIQEANGRLAAAAPVMYTALESLDRSWTEAFPYGPDRDCGGIRMGSDHLALWRQIRTALSQARGEAPSKE